MGARGRQHGLNHLGETQNRAQTAYRLWKNPPVRTIRDCAFFCATDPRQEQPSTRCEGRFTKDGTKRRVGLLLEMNAGVLLRTLRRPDHEKMSCELINYGFYSSTSVGKGLAY